MSWTPRSQRLGLREMDGPYDGVPAHLEGPLLDWLLKNVFEPGRGWQDGFMKSLSIRLRINQPAGAEGQILYRSIVAEARRDEDAFLDIVEGVLVTRRDNGTSAKELRNLLAIGGSSLTVATSNDQLIEVVEATAASVASRAMAIPDETTDELKQAWNHAYGRSPDASDAWDHAIKSLESVLIPIVEPSNSRATLGSVIGVLNNAPHKWKAIFPGPDLSGDVANLVSALRLAWPNPDRHGAGNKRPPTLDEARAVVGLAAAVVQAHRQGWVIRAR